MIHLLTADRQDRQLLLGHCNAQVEGMKCAGYGGFRHWVINEEPRNQRPDLTARIQKGFNEVNQWRIDADDYRRRNNQDHDFDGPDWIFIVENDDYYPADYLAAFIPYMRGFDFIGSDRTIYYNLRNRTWEETHHPNHSSLFCTAFRVSAMADFKWHQAHPVFLDLDIWKYARRFRRKFIDTGAIGIKHGMGLCGGKGHVQVFPNKDPDLTWLQSRVDPASFEFYSKIKV